MKFEITHSCGCTETVQLYGPMKDRERRAAYLATKPCFKCQRKADAETAAKLEDEENLPELKGSEKQVAWARTLRFYRLTNIKREYSSKELRLSFELFFKKITSAKLLIDTREFETEEAAAIIAASMLKTRPEGYNSWRDVAIAIGNGEF